LSESNSKLQLLTALAHDGSYTIDLFCEVSYRGIPYLYFGHVTTLQLGMGVLLYHVHSSMQLFLHAKAKAKLRVSYVCV